MADRFEAPMDGANIGVFNRISIGFCAGAVPESKREVGDMSATCMSEASKGRWREEASVDGLQQVVGPDGEPVPEETTKTWGHDDPELYKLTIDGHSASVELI